MPKPMTRDEWFDPEWVAAELDQRDAVYRSVKHNPCPECGAVQVQCLDWRDIPQWRCRECRHRWSWRLANA